MLEKKIINNGIVGVLSKPENENNLPIVLMFHGFGMHKDEVGDIFKILAGSLYQKRIASLRIDFRGWGESEGNMEDTTIDSLLKDTNETYQYIINSGEFDITRVGICGFSLGSAISILSSKNQLNVYKTIAAISPAGDLEKDFLVYLGENIFKRVDQEEGPYDIDLGWRQVRLKKDFFNSLKNHDIKKALIDYKGAFFAIAGSKDFSTSHVQEFVEISSSEIKNSIIIPAADHIFDAFDENKSSINKVVEVSTNWFNQTL